MKRLLAIHAGVYFAVRFAGKKIVKEKKDADGAVAEAEVER
jgi:hypothetical protein